MPMDGRHDAVKAADILFRGTQQRRQQRTVCCICVALPTAITAVCWLLLITLPTASAEQAIAEIMLSLWVAVQRTQLNPRRCGAPPPNTERCPAVTSNTRLRLPWVDRCRSIVANCRALRRRLRKGEQPPANASRCREEPVHAKQHCGTAAGHMHARTLLWNKPPFRRSAARMPRLKGVGPVRSQCQGISSP